MFPNNLMNLWISFHVHHEVDLLFSEKSNWFLWNVVKIEIETTCYHSYNSCGNILTFVCYTLFLYFVYLVNIAPKLKSKHQEHVSIFTYFFANINFI